MLKRTYPSFLAAMLFSQVALAGTEVGYDLNTNDLESTPATQVADQAVQIEDRAWGVPGVEQSVIKSDRIVIPLLISNTRIAVTGFHSSNRMTAGGAQLPQWINEIVWPLTRDLWTAAELEPYVPLPVNYDRMHILRKGFDGMPLAAQR